MVVGLVLTGYSLVKLYESILIWSSHVVRGSVNQPCIRSIVLVIYVIQQGIALYNNFLLRSLLFDCSESSEDYIRDHFDSVVQVVEPLLHV